MRAFVVEFAGADDVAVRGILEGQTAEPRHARRAGRTRHGRRSSRMGASRVHDPEAGEPA